VIRLLGEHGETSDVDAVPGAIGVRDGIGQVHRPDLVGVYIRAQLASNHHRHTRKTVRIESIENREGMSCAGSGAVRAARSDLRPVS